MAVKKKLIEVALPLDDINAASAREKSIRHGHPSTLHLWWARRPLAAARAVIWSSLVDDPSAHPEEFPTVEEQAVERRRLFNILNELVVWENSNDQRVLEAAKAEIRKSMGDDLPPLLDPFAGGGAIPLEAQRLGLEAYAQDLNPVAVSINKAMIEIPPLFTDKPAVNPKARGDLHNEGWTGNSGLAADVEYYGNWMREEAARCIGYLYPKVQVPAGQGGDGTVIAWLWARTVRCPNPACGGEAILVRSFDLSKKKGKEWHVEPVCEGGEVRFVVKPGKATREGTVNRRGATCVHCGSPIDLKYVKEESKVGRMSAKLMAVVAEGKPGRIYIAPDSVQIEAAKVEKPDDCPTGKLATHFTGGSCVPYGLDEFDKLFTNRQLTALTTFSTLVGEAQKRVEKDAVAAGLADDGVGLADGGTGARAYGEAIGVYLAFVVDKLADRCSSLCSWDPSPKQLSVRNVFGRQAIAMTWDYAEPNPFSDSTGSFNNMAAWVINVVKNLPVAQFFGTARQADAQTDNGMRGIIVSTDPPYYDNIGYADLSDFFYVWLRQSLRHTYPKLFSTMLVPKHEELVATPYREDRGKDGAREFFEEGMFSTFKQVNKYVREDVPVTIYYAFKQSETETKNDVESTASTGWETMLSAIIRAGFSITGTWPMRTEMANRNIASGTNALASSIVLVCRKRPMDAPTGTRRDFVIALKRELKIALDELRSSNIAPVDLAQSAIGPGMGVYSRFSQVLEASGNPMTVRDALQIINQEVDAYFSDQDGELDRESRFCVDLYTQKAFDTISFGEADVLARAKNVSIQGLATKGLLAASKGIVHLLGRDEVSAELSFTSPMWLVTQQLTRALDDGGITACAKLLAGPLSGNADGAKALAYRLFTIADKKNWQQEAFVYNSLVTAWPEIQSKAAELAGDASRQDTLFD